MKLRLDSFIEKYFTKSKTKNLSYRLGLDTKKEMSAQINSILLSDLYGLESILLIDFDKRDLQTLAKKLGLKINGTNEDIQNRILNLIDLPKRIPDGYHFVEFGKDGKINRIKISKEYLLNTYFDKDSLKIFCENNGLRISGNRGDLIERISLDKNIFIEDLIKVLNAKQLKILCSDLEIESEFLKEKTINKILSQIKQIERMNHSLPKKSSELSLAETEEEKKELKKEIAIPTVNFDSENLKKVFSFLESYEIKSIECTSKKIEQEIAKSLEVEFGKRNVKTQVYVTGGIIDIECLKIGIEIKTPTNRADLQKMLGQISLYLETYGKNFILFIVKNKVKIADIVSFSEPIEAQGIKVIVKEDG